MTEEEKDIYIEALEKVFKQAMECIDDQRRLIRKLRYEK